LFQTQMFFLICIGTMNETRNDFLSVLKKLGDQLWVPRQVMVEFWRNREKVFFKIREILRRLFGS